MDQNKEHVHHYDGIEEQNNPMPDWWIWLFILTVIFSFIYWIHYSTGAGPTLMEEYHVAMEEYKKSVETTASPITAETEESLEMYFKNELSLASGAGIYAEKCSMCHGADLEGKIGPNLTDKYWINGNGSRKDILLLVAKGSPAKGMPPWEGLLKPNELKNVTAFVYSKIGSQPPNAKGAEGTEF